MDNNYLKLEVLFNLAQKKDIEDILINYNITLDTLNAWQEDDMREFLNTYYRDFLNIKELYKDDKYEEAFNICREEKYKNIAFMQS